MSENIQTNEIADGSIKKRKIEEQQPEPKRWYVYTHVYDEPYEHYEQSYYGPYTTEECKSINEYDTRAKQSTVSEIVLSDASSFKVDDASFEGPFFMALETTSPIEGFDDIGISTFLGLFDTRKLFYEWIVTQPFVNSAEMIQSFRILTLEKK